MSRKRLDTVSYSLTSWMFFPTRVDDGGVHIVKGIYAKTRRAHGPQRLTVDSLVVSLDNQDVGKPTV